MRWWLAVRMDRNGFLEVFEQDQHVVKREECTKKVYHISHVQMCVSYIFTKIHMYLHTNMWIRHMYICIIHIIHMYLHTKMYKCVYNTYLQICIFTQTHMSFQMVEWWLWLGIRSQHCSTNFRSDLISHLIYRNLISDIANHYSWVVFCWLISPVADVSPLCLFVRVYIFYTAWVFQNHRQLHIILMRIECPLPKWFWTSFFSGPPLFIGPTLTH